MKNVYLFLGNEELIIKNKIDNIVKASMCDEFNLSTYNLEEVNVAEAIQDAMTPPFLSAMKVIILKNPVFLTSSKSDIAHQTKLFEDYLNQPFDTTVLIVDATGLTLDEKKEATAILLKKATVSQTNSLTPVEQEGWLKRQFAIEGFEIREDAVKLFFGRVGKNLIQAKNEVDKLLRYVTPRKVVTASDVRDVVTREIETEAFALTNSMFEKNREKTLRIYHDLIESGKDGMQLMGLVTRSMCDVMMVGSMVESGYKQNDIASALKVSTGRAYYMIKNSRAFRRDVVEESVEKLAALDYSIKTGQVDATTGLELFLCGLEHK